MAINDLNWSTRAVGLHFDGQNDSAVFPDESPAPKTISAVGDVKISTAQSKFGGSSAFFNGTNSALNLGDLSLKSIDFSISFWVRPNSYKKQILVTSYNSGTARNNTFQVYSSGFGRLAINDSNNASEGGSVLTDEWTHIEICYENSSAIYYCFANGRLVVGHSASSWPTTAGTTVWIGGSPGDSIIGGDWFDGYIDDFYIWKGVVLHTANFTPPTSPYGGAPIPDPNTIDGTLPQVKSSFVAFTGTIGNFDGRVSSVIGDYAGVLYPAGNLSGNLAAPFFSGSGIVPYIGVVSGVTNKITSDTNALAAIKSQINGTLTACSVSAEAYLYQLLDKRIIGRRYSAKLTGNPDLTFPISSISSYYNSSNGGTRSVVCPEGGVYARDIIDRKDGYLIITATEFYLDGTSSSLDLEATTSLNISYSMGSRSFSLTIQGSFLYPDAKLPRKFVAKGVQFITLQANGLYRARIELDKDIRPKDSIILPDGSEFIIGQIQQQITPNSQFMEVAE